MKPTITIEYCPKCRWLLRAAYMAQELLSTFEDELDSVRLKPGNEGGILPVNIVANGDDDVTVVVLT